MKCTINITLLCTAVLLLFLLPTATSALTVDDDFLFIKEFNAFKELYNRVYASAQEEAERLRNFRNNMARMLDFQEANPYAQFNVNRFFDFSAAELEGRLHNGAAYFARALADAENKPRVRAPITGVVLPRTLDWREHGVVTPVKDQGSCGSCWAFSTTGNIEGQWALAGNPLVGLSEQQLVSCDNIDGACNGGLMENAYDWLIENNNGAMYTEKSYPYVSGDGLVPACDARDREVGAYIVDHSMLKSDEEAMTAWLATNGPLAVAVDANGFVSYSGGVLTNCSAYQLNHAVLLVGYNNDANPPYWIIKNSWGEEWGEKGYIRIRKGTNECMINMYVISAVVSSDTPVPPSTLPPGSQVVDLKSYSDYFCKTCTSTETFPTNVCRTVPNSGSVIYQCGVNQVILHAYDSTDCSGEATVSAYQVGSCMISGWSGSTQYTCRSS